MDCEMDSYFLGIDIRIIMASRKYSVKKKDVHFGIPSLRRCYEENISMARGTVQYKK
jgi:hypothetical protein